MIEEVEIPNREELRRDMRATREISEDQIENILEDTDKIDRRGNFMKKLRVPYLASVLLLLTPAGQEIVGQDPLKLSYIVAALGSPLAGAEVFYALKFVNRLRYFKTIKKVAKVQREIIEQGRIPADAERYNLHRI